MGKKTEIEKLNEYLSDIKIEFESRIEDAEQCLAQLTEAEPKPLEHGDYGVRRKQNNRAVLYTDGGNGKLIISGPEMAWPNNTNPLDFDVEILGNIFKELRALAEPIESFEIGINEVKFDDGDLVIQMYRVNKKDIDGFILRSWGFHLNMGY